MKTSNVISVLQNLKNLILIIFITFLSACASNKAIILYNDKPDKTEDIVTLIMPIEIDVVYNDGARTTFMPGYQEFIKYHLSPGKHLLGFRYQDMLTNNEGNNESIKSRTVMIRFDAKAGEKYNINFTRPKSAEQALLLEKTLELTISDRNGVIASSYPAPETPDSNWFSAKAFDPDIAELFSEDNLANTSLKLPATNATAIEHLQYWWMMASKQEKNDFKIWLKELKAQ
ncbi:MAG: DUF2057 domain-containing protein [Gammaproteobacteria bacterium]|nr:DUF2057 domain-containing protein [Gammaproteobacteria bacterium]